MGAASTIENCAKPNAKTQGYFVRMRYAQVCRRYISVIVSIQGAVGPRIEYLPRKGKYSSVLRCPEFKSTRRTEGTEGKGKYRGQVVFLE